MAARVVVSGVVDSIPSGGAGELWKAGEPERRRGWVRGRDGVSFSKFEPFGNPTVWGPRRRPAVQVLYGATWAWLAQSARHMFGGPQFSARPGAS